MTRWAAFAGVVLVVLVLLLVLARASRSVVEEAATGGGRERAASFPDGADHLEAAAPDGTTVEPPAERPPTGRPPTEHAPTADLSTRALLANVAVSHGLFAAILLVAIYWSGVPLAALGVADAPLSTGLPALVGGIAVGGVLALANTFAGGIARAFGSDPSERLRELLAPESTADWGLLLGVVLPIIAVFEELLFRAALVGGFAVWLDVSPWLLAVLSSVAFAVGHATQGRIGILVTGLLGFALAAAFVLTNSLLVVVVAHYVVNVVEFVVMEGLEWEPFG